MTSDGGVETATRPATVREAALESAGWTRLTISRFTEWVGPIWTIAEGDKRRFGFLVEDKHDNSARRAHGGMIMMLCDEGMGNTAQAARADDLLFTVNFDCQFVSGAGLGEFVELLCEVVGSTRSLLFMRGTCTVGDRVLAACSGTWKIVSKR